MSGTYKIPGKWLDHQVRVSIIGAGGTGSQIADQLASLQTTLQMLGHPGFDVTVYDGDRVSSSNIGRQRFTRSDIGGYKAPLLVNRINQFYGLDWQAMPRYFDPARGGNGCDLLITAVDKAAFRAELGSRASEAYREGLWLDMGNGESTGNVVLGHLTWPEGQSRLPNVFDLYPELANMQAVDDEAPSCSTEEAISRQSWPVNRMAAMLASEILWNLFRNGQITHHGAFFQLNPMCVQNLPVDPNVWAMMGYQAAA